MLGIRAAAVRRSQVGEDVEDEYLIGKEEDKVALLWVACVLLLDGLEL